MPSAKVPTYRIDLSLPPGQRYTQIAKDFAGELQAIAPLYDLVLAQILVYRPIISVVKLIVRLCLRRVFNDDETKEIHSISKVAGIDLHLLVALNTLLDCLLGCTSGTVPVRGNTEGSPTHLMHFRTLDWGMPQLGNLLVSLEFVDSKSTQPGKVLARSVSYAGFVGSLTGVRPGLSMSLNHRPLLNAKTKSSIFHQVLVLLGLRPSISSQLRQVLLDPHLGVVGVTQQQSDSGLVAFAKSFIKKPSPPCYLIFSTPSEAVVIQKDFIGGNIKVTHDFIAQANHDTDHTMCCGAKEFHHRSLALGDSTLIPPEDAWLSQSAERQNFVHDNWKAYCRRGVDQRSEDSTNYSFTQNGSCIMSALTSDGGDEKVTGVTPEVLQKWVLSEPVFNEYTHFATVMDPLSGDFVCLERRL
ncbi:Acid ceramidase 1 [Colletotrichum truncatum]|uniref:Acid ceramidase 1 n=1 Tax=Colletotrichum truncatum TaxID=5467 RepID=A0ACC3YWJ1_COLTU|nr:Acid ceramidase 1 [Colletotrichum truncatum]XP_036582398.1 Acid ceramidase 1 [Colletotrichum truncatum]KAF6780737.1 Acid ceramidase 1 [Colletotrichum truncatum]KAF6791102.1 Acid ceramidase 1 [Colletotrichum truncatum]